MELSGFPRGKKASGCFDYLCCLYAAQSSFYLNP